MNTTELIALGFSVGIAAIFWIVTQWNIVRTKRELLKFQKEARDHASKLIEEQFAKMDQVIEGKLRILNIPKIDELDLLIGKRIDAIELPEIPAFDPAPIVNEMTVRVNAMLEAQGEELKAKVLESTKMSFKAMQSGLTRGLQRELGNLEGPIDEFASEILEQATASMNPTDMMMAQIMNMDVSDKFAKDNPLATLALRYGKMGLLKGISEGALPGMPAGKGLSNQQVNTPAVKTSPFG